MTTATTPPVAPHNVVMQFSIYRWKNNNKILNKTVEKKENQFTFDPAFSVQFGWVEIAVAAADAVVVRSPWDFHICIANAFTIYPTEIELMLQFWIACLKANSPGTPIYIYLYHTCTHTLDAIDISLSIKQTINILFAS